jgi:putative nucleotidyltransferase with HDIG domain
VLRSKDLFGRLNRLLRAMRPEFAKPDDAWARMRLPDAEYRVYASMDARDREHAVRVAKKLLKLKPDASDLLVRAALLHDCGKQVRPYSWRERIWVGLQPLAKTNFDDLIAQNRAPTALEVRALHPQLGAALIRAAGGDPRVAQIVERHHQAGDDADAAWIHAVDELE